MFKKPVLIVVLTALFLTVSYQTNEWFAQWQMVKSFSLLGLKLPLYSALKGLAFVAITIFFSCLIEILFFGFKKSSLYRFMFRRSNSVIVDLTVFVLIQTKLYTLFSLLFTFGTYVVLSKFINKNLIEVSLYEEAYKTSPFLSISLFILTYTFFDYWNHRILHSGLFWPLHRLHHSARELTVLTAFRNHPAQYIIAPVTRTLPLALIGAPAETAFVVFTLNGLYQQLVHFEQPMSWGWFGRYVILSPLHHRIHHSESHEHLNRNYGILSLWDRVFGTYFDDRAADNIRLGVTDGQHYSQNIVYLFVKDFKDFAMNLFSVARSFFSSKDYKSRLEN